MMTETHITDGVVGVGAIDPTVDDLAAEQRLAHAHAALRRSRRGLWRRYERLVLPALTILVITAAWEVYGQMDRIDPIQFSYPSKIVQALRGLAESGRLWDDLAVSGKEFGLGFLIAMLGVPLGIACGVVKRLGYALDPVITALYSTPIVALTPLVVIWFGLGMSSKVAVIGMMAIFPVMINTIEGVRVVDPNLHRAARSFGANQRQLITSIVLPGALPFVIAGVRLAIGRALIGLVVGEFLASTAGVGFSIRFYAENFRTAEYLGLTLMLMIIAVVLTAILRWAERRIAPWLHAEHG
jgi:ABC-type nitrate/sulfonate/bicarbonate transport system permease component